MSADPSPSTPVADAADRYFQEGLNCAQSVLRAVAEARGHTCPACIPAVALGMGGGIGHTGHTCGALTGAVLAAGLAVELRHPTVALPARKAEANRVASRLVEAFAAQFGSTDCATLRDQALSDPALKTSGLTFKAFKCTPCVRWAAAEVDRVLAASDD